MLPTQSDVEVLIDRLRKQQTETALIEAKEDLLLNTEGDRAFFIRHAAALANNVEQSYLIIGLKDKTWEAPGLSTGSYLLEPDNAQQRFNQVLAGKLDPNLAVRYGLYQMGGIAVGIIAIRGEKAPYIVAINDVSYGGKRTRGAPEFIYRGAIYRRYGDQSIIVNRQSDFFSIINKSRSSGYDNNQPDEFIVKNFYLDVDTDEFGRHPLSRQLTEAHISQTKDKEFLPARSWVSFVFVPMQRECKLEPITLKNKLLPNQRIGRDGQWFHGIPEALHHILLALIATPKELSGEFNIRKLHKSQDITHFLRILPTGHIEFAGTDPLFFERDGLRCFGFVSIIGTLWQFLYCVKSIYKDAGYDSGVQILLNLVGTKNSRLADFAGDSINGGWISPFDPFFHQRVEDFTNRINIQIQQVVELSNKSDQEIEELVMGFATELGLYFGQDQPRCYNPKTRDFPIQQYIRNNG